MNQLAFKSSWHRSLLDILGNRLGYGRNVTGGAAGQVYHVTNLNDSGAGSLRAALESTNPYWIVFDLDGTITLSSDIFIKSNKTIDGRGANITISGNGLRCGSWGTINTTDNVIFENLKFDNITGNTGIGITNKASNVWIDHCTWTLPNSDEALYLGGGGDNGAHEDPAYGITISWCHWVGTASESPVDKAMLISDPSDYEDAAGTITAHHNHFELVYVRCPLGRWVKYHSFNNYYDRDILGVEARTHMQFLSENDILRKNSSGVTLIIQSNTSVPDGETLEADNLKVTGAYLLDSANYEEVNPDTIFTPPYSYSLDTADATLQSAIAAGAGWLDVPLP